MRVLGVAFLAAACDLSMGSDLTITATGEETDDESKGIKVEGSEDSPGEGYVVVNGGHVTITSVSKGITASWDVDEDAETTSTDDDPDPYVEINNGYIIVSTADDCLNAGDSIVINDGYLYCASSENDAIDANGTLTINGGVIVAIGASAPEAAFDCDNNTFTITGGTFVGIGGSTSTPTKSACTQNVIITGSGSKGSSLALKSGSGTIVFTYSIPSSYSTMLLCPPRTSRHRPRTLSIPAELFQAKMSSTGCILAICPVREAPLARLSR